MTAYIDPIIASARIVSPEEAAIDRNELLIMQLSLAAARRAGAPLYIVQFADGVAAMVSGDPNDAVAWRHALIKVHQAALGGQIGPVETGEPLP